MKRENDRRYDDIIALPHPVSLRHSPMSTENRAAQFAPFAALRGYDEAIAEAARLPEQTPLPDDIRSSALDCRLRLLVSRMDLHPEITAIVFEPDPQKNGGAYRSVTGCVRRIDEVSRTLILEDRTVLHIESICALEGEVFRELEHG